MLKDRQRSEFDGFLDCIILESVHHPIADAQTSVGIGLFVERFEQGRLVSRLVSFYCQMRRAGFLGHHPPRDKEHHLASRKWRRESTPEHPSELWPIGSSRS